MLIEKIKLKTIENFKDTIFEILNKYDGKEFNLMIPGGSVLTCLDDDRYELLETTKWKIFFCDERMEKKYSNFDSASNFIKRLKGEVFPMQSANEYEKILNKNTMDVCLLGVGDNGHICSLWPDSDLDSKRIVEEVEVKCPNSPKRITVTLSFINKFVKNLYFVIPPKNSKPKEIEEPAGSILERLKIDYKTICTG